jgi:hypothetical protein
LYVLALTDVDLGTWKAGSHTLRSIDLGPLYAVYEQRRTAPPLDDDNLREQHRLVMEIARRAHATLPARFGALVDRKALADRVHSHEAELREAIGEVRDRVQMTVRVTGEPPRAVATPAASGREYLEARRKLASPLLPETAAGLLAALRPLVTRERLDPGAGGLLATIYHLVDRRNGRRYREVAAGAALPNVMVTGPWPPFAFTPQLW